MSIVCSAAPSVNPAPIVAPSGALAAFGRWAADRMAGSKGVTTAYPFAPATEDDGPRPTWSERYEPTRRQEVEAEGQRIGLEGGWPTFEEVFPGASVRESLLFALEFSEGLHAGHKMRARRLGFQVAVDGGPCELPTAIPARFEIDFECGWDEGEVERLWREAELADFFAKCDVEQDMWDLEMENRARMGWPVPASWCPGLEA